MEQNRVPKGVRAAGQFAATAHAEPALSLNTGPDAEHRLERDAIEAIYTAGRGRGRNRHGNLDRITEAYDAAGAYVDSLGEPRNQVEAEARNTFQELRARFETEKEHLDDKALRDRKFEVAGKANWVIEYRSTTYTNRLQGLNP